jgi:DNA-binding phage protein
MQRKRKYSVPQKQLHKSMKQTNPELDLLLGVIKATSRWIHLLPGSER